MNEIGKSLLHHLKLYQNGLKDISEEEFQQTPQKGGWSISEVYCHVNQVNSRCLLAIEKCLRDKKPDSFYALPLITKVIFFLGKFPPWRFKAPEKTAAMVEKRSREEIRNELIKFNQKLQEILPRILKSKSGSRVKHPKLGMLNIRQWLQFMDIHTRHHLKQLARVQRAVEKENFG